MKTVLYLSMPESHVIDYSTPLLLEIRGKSPSSFLLEEFAKFSLFAQQCIYIVVIKNSVGRFSAISYCTLKMLVFNSLHCVSLS